MSAKTTTTKITGDRKRRRDPTSELNAQQEKFCQRYALHKNGAQAYGEAYPKSLTNTSQYRAESASRMLAQPKISSRIKHLSEKIAEIADKKFEVTATRVLQELAAIAFQNADDYFEWGSFTREKLRKSKETGLYEPMLDQNGEPLVEEVPFARIKPSTALSREQKAAVVAVSETISRTGDRVIEAKMADKLSALKLIGQHLGMFKELREVTGKNGQPIQQNVTHTLPDLKQVNDPIEALKQFEALRMGLHAGTA